MDPSSIIGLAMSMGLVLTSALMEGMNPLALFSPSALILITGGTIGATLTCYTLAEMKALIAGTMVIIRGPSVTMKDVFDTFGELATLVRREGLLVLESHPIKLNSSLLKRGITLMVDGMEHSLLRDTLTTQLYTYEEEAKLVASVYQTAGGFAPTMGIIGTVMGLVNVLGHLEGNSNLGESIAVAFLATFYGIGSANILFLPINKKMVYCMKREVQTGLVIIEGILSMQAGDNPRVIQEKLKSYISEQEWVHLEPK